MRLAMKKNGFLLLFSVIAAFSFVGDASFSRLNLVNPYRVIQIILKSQQNNRTEKKDKLEKADDKAQNIIKEEEKKENHPIRGFQYRKEDGTLASGYFQLDEEFYYFNLKTGYCVVNQWKEVKIGENTYSLYFGTDGKQVQDVSAFIDLDAPLLLKINTKMNRIIIFTTDKEGDYKIPVKVMLCSAGKASTPTKKGIYQPKKVARWHRLNGNVYGQYCCRITQHYLIHSVFYSQNQNPKTLNVREYNKLGESASHGCVRVCVADAKWIYERVEQITVWTTDEEESLPLKAPLLIPPIIVNGNRGIDPTDLTVSP